MNLEDRLRSHMHSADDLFVDSGRDAGAIASAGRRRTRRNQVGGAAAGSLLALGLVFGVSTQLGDDGDEARTATPPIEAAEAANADAGADFAIEQSQPGDGTTIFDGPLPPFELVVGIDSGFAGLRIIDGVVTGIRSDDGLVWSEETTSGIPAGVIVQTFVHDDGTFAALFSSFDEETGSETTFIGTSSNLQNWTLMPVLPNENSAFLSGLAVGDDTVVSFAQTISRREDEVDSEFSSFIITGPVGGPYEVVPFTLPAFGVDRIVHTPAGFAASVFTDGPPETYVSRDGRTWTRTAPADSTAAFSTIAVLDDRLLSVSNGDFGTVGFRMYESADLAASWSDVEPPREVADVAWWSFDIRSSEATSAVLLSGEGDEEFTTRFELIATTGEDWRSIDFEPYVPEGAHVTLVAVNAEEALLQIFPESGFDEDLAASSGLAEESKPAVESGGPIYVRVPLF